MKVALLNPPWDFTGSIYFGCREPHLPIEYGLAAHFLQAAGHAAEILDAHLMGWSLDELVARLQDFRPDIAVITTAPSYLFWRCAPPELRVPQMLAFAIRDFVPLLCVVGPHASVTPQATLRKLRADIAVRGECEEAVAEIADHPEAAISGTATKHGTFGPLRAARFTDAPVLEWPAEMLARHAHHHHRFDSTPDGPGAEIEASRGCPYHCSFCAKTHFRDRYRRRPVADVIAEAMKLKANGARYIYFIDEIFLPDRALLEGLQRVGLPFGVQTRIDLWKPDMIARLGDAGCVSVEAGVESLTPEGRDRLDKSCRMGTEALAERLRLAKARIPFVQANLIEVPEDSAEEVQAWRQAMRQAGVWANDPVPLFAYPGATDYVKRWGVPDDEAWERALDAYLSEFGALSDLQESHPKRLHELELSP